MNELLHVLENSTISIGRVQGKGFGIIVVPIILIFGMIILPRFVAAQLPFLMNLVLEIL